MQAYRPNTPGKLALLIALWMLCFTVSGARSTEPDLEKVLESYETACRRLESLDIYASEVFEHRLRAVANANGEYNEFVPFGANEKATTVRLRLRTRFLQGKYRTELLDDSSRTSRATFVSVWNRQTHQVFDGAGMTATVDPIAHTRPAPFGIDYLNTFLCYDGSMTYCDFVRSRSPGSRSVSVDGDLVIVSAEPEPHRIVHHNKTGVRLYLSPDEGYLPRRIDTVLAYGTESPVLNTRLENTLEEVTPGVWLPTRSRFSTFVCTREFSGSARFGEESSRMEIEVDRSASKFNEPLDDAVFRFELPAGTQVLDRVQQAVYRAGADKP